MENAILILGRLLIGFYFAFHGFWNIYHWRPTMEVMIQKNIPHPWLLLPIGITWQILTGCMVMFNIHIKLAALLLIPFTIVAVCLFHPFWKFHGEHRALNMNIFIANMTIGLGALLLLLSNILA